ncbi:MAG: leucine-rich repeat domain-containing protein [Oscillospiraceae bacterium]|nr:leucine-rich repeat domain-containing protein [Oscillospiraceae bacterium]
MDFKIKNDTLTNYTGHSQSSLTIPETVKEIGSWSLDNHPELYYIVIPPSVWKIGYHSFYEDENLTSIVVDRKNKYFSSIGSVSKSILCDKEKKTLLCCPNGRESVHIPASIISMKETDAFAGCKKLKNITVDEKNPKYTVLNGVLYEHDNRKLTKLVRCPVDKVSLHIPDSITEIYNHAFEGCTELEEIILPEGITKLEGYTFKHCHNLKRVQFSKNLKNIGDSCFRECYHLEEVILPNGMKGVIAGAFNNCRKLKKLVIPESVSFTGHIAGGCVSLETLICHGIEIRKQEFENLPSEASSIIWLIVQKRFDEKLPPDIKYRIIYQMFVRNPDDEKINIYIKQNFDAIISILIEINQIQMVQNYIKSFRRYLNSQNLDKFIRCAIDNQKYEIQIFLTNLKYQRNDFTEKDWTL